MLSGVLRRIRGVATCCMASGIAATPLAAQSAVRGVLTSGGTPVAGAQVFLDPGAPAPAVSDSAGRFLVSTLAGGRLRLLVRAIGFTPISRSLVLAADDTLVLNLTLERQVTSLSEVRVEEGRVDPVMTGFEERRRAGFGRFITREMLADQEHSTVTTVLRRVGGLRFIRRPPDCGGGFAASSGRAGAIERQSWMRCTNGVAMPVACYLNVFVDGLPHFVAPSAEPPNLDQFLVMAIEAMEVYRSNAETPIQFQRAGASCGVLLLWTRRPSPG